MSIVVRMAEKKDGKEIVNLLEKGKLNTEGIDQQIENFIVAVDTDSGEMVGTAGMEVADEHCGLLRSLALTSPAWNVRIGMDLIRILLHLAEQKGLREIYLLTRSAPFFQLLEFVEVDHDEIPPSIQQSTHYQQYVHDLPTVMVYKQG